MNSFASVAYLSTDPFDFETDPFGFEQRIKAIEFRKRYLEVLQRVAAEWSKSTLPNGHYYGIEFSEPIFPLKPMDPIYNGEKISYFTQGDLLDLQVYPINGLIHKGDLSLYSSSIELDSINGDGEMVVMDSIGNMFIAPKKRGEFHHSSFFHGKPVAFAGLIFVREGKIENLVCYSGHYSPGAQEKSSFLRQLHTNYLVTKIACGALQINSKGLLEKTIALSPQATLEDLFNKICNEEGFCKNRCRLIYNSRSILAKGSTTTIAESNLPTGCSFYALEFGQTPGDRVYPNGSFKLMIIDSGH